MSSMRHTVTTVSNTSNLVNHENNLDALLDDLQSSISRSGSNVNGVTEFREVRRTVNDGTPGGTTTHYQIEYLHPANTTTHITESSHQNSQLGSGYGTTYKQVYKYDGSNKDSVGGDVRLRQNISELDSLLDDLNTAQQNTFSESAVVTHRNTSGVDPGLLEPITSTPHSSRTVERHYREEKRARGRSSSPISAKRELIFTGGRSLDPSPVRHETYYNGQQGPARQQVYRYEKTTTTRTTAPVIQDATHMEDGSSTNASSRLYNYTNEGTPLAITHRAPSPAGQGQTSYHYSSTATRDTTPLPPPQNSVERVEKVTRYHTGDSREGYPREGYTREGYPKDGYPREGYPKDDYPERHDSSPHRYPASKTTHSYSYSSSRESRETRPEIPKTPPPHRSPSPVSFPQPPLPNVKASARVYHYEPSPHSPSPQPGEKFSPSDPSRTLTYNVSPPQQTITTYKYSTTTSSNRYPEEVPLLPRPFPNPSPSPTPEQQPPKKLDELMASFSDTDVQQYHTSESTTRHYDSHHPPLQKEVRPPAPEKVITSTRVVEKKDESKNVAGPPVYYPPGELFTKKEESMTQKQVGGGKYKEKGKYEYKESSKSKSSESSGKAIVPVCLPLCCGIPCVIM